MIYINGKPVSVIAAAPAELGARMFSIVIKGGKIVWQAIRSCYGKGWWIEDKPWLDDDAWKD